MPENSMLLKAYSYGGCNDIAGTVLEILKKEIDLRMWMVARMENNMHSCVVTAIIDEYYGMRKGDRHKWSDTICCRMLECDAPNYTPDVSSSELYRDLPIMEKHPVRSHIGVPLYTSAGTILGVICGTDPEIKEITPEQINNPVIHLARLLASVYEKDMQLPKPANEIDRRVENNLIDHVSGMFNLHGWKRHLQLEMSNIENSESPAGIIIIQLQDTSIEQEQIRRTADIIRSLINPLDICARTDETRIIVHTVDTSESVIREIVGSMSNRFSELEIKASLAWACSDGGHDLNATINRALVRLSAT